jgi:YEATS domain-containing protein 4
MQGVTVAAPIIYGSVAFWLGKKADDTATHRWTLFIRGPNDEDLSTFISHVAFSLHPSFSEPIRSKFHLY